MRTLSKREAIVVNLFKFIGVDHSMLQITQTGLDKGYTDATVEFREFLKRTGIHEYATQTAGKKSIVDVFGLTVSGPEVLKLSFLRPATKGGRMFRVSMLGGLRHPLQIQVDDVLIFFVRDNQLNLLNLTQSTDRMPDRESSTASSKVAQGAAILAIAKNRILHVMESIPQCEANSGTGARVIDIGELSGMFLEKRRGTVVNALLDELDFEGQIETSSNNPKKYRLCR